MTIIKLFERNGNAKSWGPKDVLKDAAKVVDEGFDGEILVLMRDKKTGGYDVRFLQCGMSASEMIGLLEIAKLNVYRDLMS